ncbi:MAG: hypothetical protein KKE86_15225 [Planctomycetes bacterium]|nr:hypothetical protein [Planctomycetota bacterium]MBU4400670.1 hypothetical protein [Planctomycetota bacterium]MCG2682691.1 hypothetical protein [Planctomycetales bacterium]
METHFLADIIGTEPTFLAEPWYNPYGDCIVYKMVDEAAVADRIDDLLTIYRSAEDERPIGFQIKGVAEIIKKFGLAGLAVSPQVDDDSMISVSIAAIILAAYEEGAATIGRRNGYATAMEFNVPEEKRRIFRKDLLPA